MMKTYVFGQPQASSLLIQMVDDHDLSVIEKEVEAIRNHYGDDFCLVAVKVNRWNEDLSPWDGAPVFGDEPFGHGASATLKELEEEIIPAYKRPHQKLYLGGYSLAGLFALWAAYQSNVFDGIAAVSPSVWFEGMVDYVKTHPLLTNCVYLSLGDREERTRHPLMSQVGHAIREIDAYYQSQNISHILEWNKGNHFKQPDLRMAKGFGYLLKSEEKA